MVYKLPCGGWEWVNTDFDWLSLDEKSDVGCLVDCDIQYPELDEVVECLGRKITGRELQDFVRDYMPCPENKKIDENDLSEYQRRTWKKTKEQICGKEMKYTTTNKLICDFKPKKNYVCHYLLLKFYYSLGLKISVNKVLKFKQDYIMRDYIETCVKKRKEADKQENATEVEFWKLLMNSVYGKQLENVENRMLFNLLDLNTEKDINRLEKYASSPRFYKGTHYTPFTDELVGISRDRTEHVYDKPVFIGQAVLDISKLIMFKFWYNVLKVEYPKPDQLRLLMTDTDSLLFSVDTDDYFNEMMKYKNELDLSKMDKKYMGDFFDETNQKELSKFKDECNGLPIFDFVGHRSKIYAYKPMTYQKDGDIYKMTESKKAKGVSRATVKKCMKFEEYKQCIDECKVINKQVNTIRSEKHQLYTLKMNKTALSPFDDKNYICDDGIETYPYGYYKIKNN
jgi:hypothetical protein